MTSEQNPAQNRPDHDIIIVGAGIIGAATALLLARSGFSVGLIEARKPKSFDISQPVGLRVSALSPGSAAILEQAGAWQAITALRSCPYREMLVQDGFEHDVSEQAGNEQAGVKFSAAVFGLERLGTIVENELVMDVLYGLLATSGVQLYCPARVLAVDNGADQVRIQLDDQCWLTAQLAVAADGARSVLRQTAGIEQDFWAYNQRGLVSVVRKSQANPGVAWQRFLQGRYQGGPLAFLPLSDGSSSIVWTLPEAIADELLALDDAAFAQVLGAASAGWLGEVESCGPRASFPLSMTRSRHCVARRLVLLGDAAHVVHPLAGQGANLGLADAAALVEILLQQRSSGADLADAAMLRRYARWRQSEHSLMASGIDGIRSLFMPAWLGGLRRLGMGWVNRSWHGRDGFIRQAAGLGRNAPRLARGEQLQALQQGQGQRR